MERRKHIHLQLLQFFLSTILFKSKLKLVLNSKGKPPFFWLKWSEIRLYKFATHCFSILRCSKLSVTNYAAQFHYKWKSWAWAQERFQCFMVFVNINEFIIILKLEMWNHLLNGWPPFAKLSHQIDRWAREVGSNHMNPARRLWVFVRSLVNHVITLVG